LMISFVAFASVPTAEAHQSPSGATANSPSLSISPSPDKVVLGGTVTYTVTIDVTDTAAIDADITYEGLTVTEPDGGVRTILDILNAADDVTLSAGQSLTYGPFSYTTIAAGVNIFTGTSTGYYHGIAHLPSGSTATVAVVVIDPDISLTKTPSDDKVSAGTEVTYTFTVENTGDVTLENVAVVDSNLGSITLSSTTLDPGEVAVGTASEVLTEDKTNTATATGDHQLGTVSAEASASVDVIHPDIALTKTPDDDKVAVGAEVTYTYEVTNTGDTTLYGVTVFDVTFGVPILGPVDLISGDSASGTYTTTLLDDTLNVATASGVDQEGTEVTATARAFVDVLHPSIDVEKTVSDDKVSEGATVTYTITVHNNGDTPLSNVDVVDDVYGPIALDQTLAVSETKTYTFTATLTDDVTNTVTATGEDQEGTQVRDVDTVSVDVLHPSIELTKTPDDDKVSEGTEVTYTFIVHNNGDTTLFDVTVVDSNMGAITLDKTTLDPSEIAVGTASEALTEDKLNTAVATGVDQEGTEVTATAEAFVDVIHPSIDVEKTCEPHTQPEPGNITWTITVHNNGDTTLFGVNVTDTRSGVIAGGLTLNPSEVQVFTYTETGLAAGNYTNVATAWGVDQEGITVRDQDDATCVVTPRRQFPKQFTSSYGFGGFTAPEIIDGGLNSTVVGLYSGPRVSWNVTYFVENSLAFLGDQYDGQAHNFTLWDKWGGNLMALNYTPVAFNVATNRVWLSDGTTFIIDPAGYKAYVGSGVPLSPSQGTAWITLHLGDKQNGTNPGKGKGTTKDGSSYDADVVWYIGELAPGESATLTIIIAPGKNPGGVLQFSSPGWRWINTGPRVRVYGDSFADEDFLYAIDKTIQLGVNVLAD